MAILSLPLGHDARKEAQGLAGCPHIKDEGSCAGTSTLGRPVLLRSGELELGAHTIPNGLNEQVLVLGPLFTAPPPRQTFALLYLLAHLRRFKPITWA